MGMQSSSVQQLISQLQPPSMQNGIGASLPQPIPGQTIQSTQPAIGQSVIGNAITMPGQTAQPTIGQPNQYSNTTGQQPTPAYNQQQMPQAGKGKGA